MFKSTPRKQAPSIIIHKHGFMTQAPSLPYPLEHGTTKRGSIKGWSARSRMRLRRWMLTHEPSIPCYEFGVTLTVPGPAIETEQMKSLWKSASREIERNGWSGVWRLEIQKRGQPHWHLILHVPRVGDGAGGAVIHIGDEAIQALMYMRLSDLWRKALDQLGPVDHECTINGTRSLYSMKSRWDIPGAEKHSIDCKQVRDDEGSHWRRYIQDHTSKAKQAQVADGYGRHWGIIGRKLYVLNAPRSVEALSDKSYYRVVRWLQRMVSGTHKCPKAPFGRKRSSRSRRGRIGRSVWFGNIETINRLITHANDSFPPF